MVKQLGFKQKQEEQNISVRQSIKWFFWVYKDVVFTALSCVCVFYHLSLSLFCKVVESKFCSNSVIWWLQWAIVGMLMSFLELLYFLRKKHSVKGNAHFHQLLIELQRVAYIYIHSITIQVEFWKGTWGQIKYCSRSYMKY